MDSLLQLKSLGYVALAMILGALIGSEREMAEKSAGMRTHMLVAGAAALFIVLGTALVKGFGEQFPSELIRSDPIRIIEAVVTGVAFLGAGTIIRRGGGRSPVQGLTTAASLLFTAAVGISAATNQLVIAVGTTLMALATLRLAHAMEIRLRSKADKSNRHVDGRPGADKRPPST